MFNGTWLCMTVRVDYMHWRRDEHDDERSLLMANILYIQFKNCRKFHFVFQYYSCKAVYSRLPYALHNVKGVVKSLKLIWWWFLRDYITSEIVFKFAPVVGDEELEEDAAGRERVKERHEEKWHRQGEEKDWMLHIIFSVIKIDKRVYKTGDSYTSLTFSLIPHIREAMPLHFAQNRKTKRKHEQHEIDDKNKAERKPLEMMSYKIPMSIGSSSHLSVRTYRIESFLMRRHFLREHMSCVRDD